MITQPLPTPAMLTESLLSVSKQMHLTLSLDAQVALFANVFSKLLPDSMHCFRLLKPASQTLDIVYANGRLTPDHRDTLQIPRQALTETRQTSDDCLVITDYSIVIPTDTYVPVFEKGACGIVFLLCDRHNLYGALNIEFTQPIHNLEDARTALWPFIHLMVASLRNTRLLERSIRLSEYWEQLLESANAPVVVIDPEQTVLVINRAFEQTTGLQRNQVLGKPFTTLLPATELGCLLPMVTTMVEGHSVNEFEVRFDPHPQTGQCPHIAFNTAPVKNQFGQLERIILVGQDLSRIKALQRQVIHSEKLATLGQIAAGVAHELNNPLTSITVYSDYLVQKLAKTIEAEDLEKLNRIREGAARIQSFSRDLVAYARPSEETPTLLDIRHVVEKSVFFCEHIIGESKAVVTCTFDDDLPGVYGISGQIEQVLVNLITNAAHAVAETGRIDLIVTNHSDDQVAIAVKDNGCGIPPALQNRVFEPFFTTKQVGQGTGLGLSIVRNILKNHNAQISVDSQENVGTTMLLIFKGRR